MRVYILLLLQEALRAGENNRRYPTDSYYMDYHVGPYMVKTKKKGLLPIYLYIRWYDFISESVPEYMLNCHISSCL